MLSQSINIRNVFDMNNRWIVERSHLCLKQRPNCLGVQRISTKSIDRFSWEGDQTAPFDDVGCSLDLCNFRVLRIHFEQERLFHHGACPEVCATSFLNVKQALTVLFQFEHDGSLHLSLRDLPVFHKQPVRLLSRVQLEPMFLVKADCPPCSLPCAHQN